MQVAVAVGQILRVAQVGLVVVVSDMLTLLLVIKMQQQILAVEVAVLVITLNTFLVLAVRE
jgi:hypothetical protein